MAKRKKAQNNKKTTKKQGSASDQKIDPDFDPAMRFAWNAAFAVIGQLAGKFDLSENTDETPMGEFEAFKSCIPQFIRKHPESTAEIVFIHAGMNALISKQVKNWTQAWTELPTQHQCAWQVFLATFLLVDDAHNQIVEQNRTLSESEAQDLDRANNTPISAGESMMEMEHDTSELTEIGKALKEKNDDDGSTKSPF